MSKIAAMAKTAAYEQVRGVKFTKLAADSHVPVEVLARMVKQAGVPVSDFVARAHQDPKTFFELAIQIEKQANLLDGAAAGVGSAASGIGSALGAVKESPEGQSLAAAGANLGEAGMQGMQRVGGAGKRFLDWIKADPAKAALLGLGGAGGAYGLTRLMRGKKDEKRANDLGSLVQRRAELVKEARDTVQHNSLVIVGRYMTKLAAEAESPVLRQGFHDTHAALLATRNIHWALAKGFPKMARDQRQTLAKALTTNAMSSFLKEACGGPECHGASNGSTRPIRQSKTSTFHGKPAEGHSWMKANS